jgi:hypothetical protein
MDARPLSALLLAAMTACASASGTAPAASPPAPGTAGTPAVAAQPPAAGQLLPLRYDAATGRVFLTVPRLEEDLLHVITLGTGLGSTSPSLDRGETGRAALVRFERRGARVLLVQQNSAFRAVGGDAALEQSVAESFPRSVLASFAVQSESPAGVVVDATDFLLSDVYDVAGRLRSARVGTVRVDRDRSYIEGARTRSFDDNTEVRSVLSYVTDAIRRRRSAGTRRTAGSSRSSSTTALCGCRRGPCHPCVRSPGRPVRLELLRLRAGLRRGLPAARRREVAAGAARHAAYLRGELVEPVKPIVYYMDPAIPEPYRSAFIEGGMWWNGSSRRRAGATPSASSAARRCGPAGHALPRDLLGAPHGARTVGGAVVPRPAHGRDHHTVVRMDSYRSLVTTTSTWACCRRPARRSATHAESFAMARRRQHTAHEIGHTLGLAHNYIAAAQGRSSVMDYPYPLIRLDAQGRSTSRRRTAVRRRARHARHPLRVHLVPQCQAEAEGLRRIVREAEARGLRYVGDAHVGAAGSLPSASQWIEGDDMLSALDRTMPCAACSSTTSTSAPHSRASRWPC